MSEGRRLALSLGLIGAQGLVALVLASACADADPASCEDGPASVVLGRPQPFVALADGDAVELVYGPQGGYHINLAVELRGLGEDPLIELFGEIDGVRLGEDVVAVSGECVDGRVVLEDLWLIWAATPDELDGRSASVEVRATSAEGRSATTVVELVIDDPQR